MKNQLIQIYLLVCQIYDSHSSLKYQRLSNFKPQFTDQELIAVYLFGHLNHLYQQRAIYQFIKRYWLDWFPRLPSYQAFNRRLNLLENNFQAIFAALSERLQQQSKQASGGDYLIDSMPVMLACGTRAKRARVALELARTGFSAVKQINFHGVRLHLISRRQTNQLPLPAKVWLKEANVHDLTAVREKLDELPGSINLFGDKAYADTHLKSELEERHIKLWTPLKKPKNKELSLVQKQFSQMVSSIRQPIESFFKWLIDKTDIQRANKVRSTEGLIIHCIGKLTVALLLLNFYY
jgi:hypothetical protein